ncbi:MAG TPA: sulfur carrier protein ThiS [Planctomycetota bacterium]|nr:sulfur carrier protein ThiS [Planctomycetota bacterium]
MSEAAVKAIRLLVNGETRELPAGTTVAAALASLGVSGEGVAVERNGRIVPRSEHAAVVLREGDALEVVTFVGGG